MKTCLSLVILSLATVIPSLAQDDKPREPSFYKVDFVIKEVEGGKAVNSRAYSSIVSQNDRGSIRTGNKVPMPTGSGNSYQYYDVGITIDCSLTKELADRVVLNLNIDISSNATTEAPMPPVLRQNKWTSTVVVPLRKAITVFSSDDPTSKRQMQVELTATPVK